MKKVLIPTDFSPCANNAVEFAIQSGRGIPMAITLLHAFDVKGSIYTDYMGINKEFNEWQLDEVRKKLHDQKEAIERDHGISVNTMVIREALGRAILQATEQAAYDLILMGTVGAGEKGERFWGSNTSEEIGRTDTPVLVVPLGYTWKKPANILFATNHFEEDPAILDLIFELTRLFKARLQLAIFTDEDDDSSYTFLDHTRTLPNYERKLRRLYHENNISMVQLYGIDFGETLQKHIDENAVDLLVMVTYHRTLWDRFFHPSQTRWMAYHTSIPLLALPARKVEERQ